MLFILFLRPAAPVESPGGFDAVTVYLRDSRRLLPPSAPQPRIGRAPSRRAEASRAIAGMPRPLGRNPAMPVHATTSIARAETIHAKPARTTDTVSATRARSADAPRPNPSPVDQRANRARDSRTLYLRELADRLSQVKRYPQVAVALHEEGTVLLSFQIARDGRLLAWNIASSSGHQDLDSEVGRMVVEAAPFPPFPSSWHRTREVFRVPIGFYLRW